MFVQDFVEIEAPFESVARLMTGIEPELRIWAETAIRRGEELAVGPSGAWTAMPVELYVGEPMHGTESLVIPIEWEAKSAAALFPKMTAELALHPVGETVTHAQFRGRYEPPMRVAGRVLDAAGLHRLAETTVRNLMVRFKRAVDLELDAQQMFNPESTP